MFSLSGECVSDKTGKITVGTLKDPDSRSYVYIYIYLPLFLYTNRRLSIFLLLLLESEIESDPRPGSSKKIGSEEKDFCREASSFFNEARRTGRWTRSAVGLVGVR